MDLLVVAPANDIPVLYYGIGCVLMAILGGFTSDFNVIVSLKGFFRVLVQSLFIGILTMFVGLSVKIPWYTKLFFAGVFGFIGIPSIILLVKNLLSGVSSSTKYLEDVVDSAQDKTSENDKTDVDEDNDATESKK